MAQQALAEGADVKARTFRGRTPLRAAAISAKDFEFTKFLIEQGADVNVRDEEGETPLHWAANTN